MQLEINDRELLIGISSLAHQHNNYGDQRQTSHQSFHTLSKGYDHTVGESTDVVNKGIEPHTMYSLYDSDTGSITNDHTIGQSGTRFNAEVSHYHGIGELYFIRSMHTNSVTLRWSSQQQSSSQPKLTRLPWANHYYAPYVTHRLLDYLQPKVFLQNWLKYVFFSPKFYFNFYHEPC